jgi:hypothetical protein
LRSAALAYCFALALGVAMALTIFPLDFLFPQAGLPWLPFATDHGDTVAYIVAQRYLINDSWRWPPTFTANLDTQIGGTNIAFADAIPLLALALKAVRWALPEGFHGVSLFYGICWVLQPVAAVWALRGAGERRLLPAIGIAVAAISMPAWIARYGHAALSGHFLVLAGIGFYFRLAQLDPGQRSRFIWPAAAALQVVTVLVNPYLALMNLALLAAVPITRMVRRQRFVGDLLRTSACAAAVAGVLALFGYFGAKGEGGYGLFAMNLLSPLWPAGSGLIGAPFDFRVDATGLGGWEGYNWLGLGLVLGLGVGVLTQPTIASNAVWSRHVGLGLALLVLTLLAITHRIGLAAFIIVDLGHLPEFLKALGLSDLLESFRSSGRLFWPVAYVLLVGAMFLLARTWPVLCIVFAVIQFIDAGPLRGSLQAWARDRPVWSAESEALRRPIADANSLTLLPSLPCLGMAARNDTHALLFEVLSLASERAVPVSTTYAARWYQSPVCRDDQLAAAPFAPGELRVILPSARPSLAHLVPRADERCFAVGQALACR